MLVQNHTAHAHPHLNLRALLPPFREFRAHSLLPACTLLPRRAHLLCNRFNSKWGKTVKKVISEDPQRGGTDTTHKNNKREHTYTQKSPQSSGKKGMKTEMGHKKNHFEVAAGASSLGAVGVASSG